MVSCQPQRRRVSALTSTEQITSSGTTVEKTFTMPEVPVRESSEIKRQNAALHQKAEAPSICAKSAPTPAAMMTNIPKRKNSCSSPTASRRSGIGRRITRASVWSPPVRCTSRSSNTPKKKESATASSRPAIPCQPKQPKNCHSSWPET